ncbi:hypothetical protein PGTUg99_037373 [Puccinia graminis f. sp. tritici]|uniref:Uncharacterized protein n=1 Tax=Puccinia graminis f. sp. tritici TaxID=56615 RepID=A0A5B0R9B3_PUCGR|nr:hypothetical protein PGTUg99_037373 [Puccinia graminis f. sp. tritici]
MVPSSTNHHLTRLTHLSSTKPATPSTQESSKSPLNPDNPGYDCSLTQDGSGTQAHHGSWQKDPSWAHAGQQDIPSGQYNPGASFTNHSRQQMMEYSIHKPMVYLGPPHMGYPAPMNYGTAKTFHHSAPTYTVQPQHPYWAPPQSHLAPRPAVLSPSLNAYGSIVGAWLVGCLDGQ